MDCPFGEIYIGISEEYLSSLDEDMRDGLIRKYNAILSKQNHRSNASNMLAEYRMRRRHLIAI